MTTIESQTARLEDEPAEAATGDTAIDDNPFRKLADVSTYIAAFEHVMKSPAENTRLTETLARMKAKLTNIAINYQQGADPEINNKITAKMTNCCKKMIKNYVSNLPLFNAEITRSPEESAKILSKIPREAETGDDILALAGQMRDIANNMRPAFILAKQCAVISAECGEVLENTVHLLDDGTIALREEENIPPPAGVRQRTSATPPDADTRRKDLQRAIGATPLTALQQANDANHAPVEGAVIPSDVLASLESTGKSEGLDPLSALAALRSQAMSDAVVTPAKRRTSRQATQPHRRTLFQRITFRNRKPKPTSGRGGKGQKR